MCGILLQPETIFDSKCCKKYLATLLCPGPQGGAYSAPQIPVAVFKGPFNGRKLRVGRGQGGQLLDPPLVFT